MVVAGSRPTPLDGIDGGIVEIMERCWQQDPAARPSFLEVEDCFANLLHNNRRTWPAQRDVGVTLSKLQAKQKKKRNRLSLQ